MINLKLIGRVARKEREARTKLVPIFDRMLIEIMSPPNSRSTEAISDLGDEALAVLNEHMGETLSIISIR